MNIYSFIKLILVNLLTFAILMTAFWLVEDRQSVLEVDDEDILKLIQRKKHK